MTYAALYTLVATAANISHKLAKLLVGILSAQAAILYLLASVSNGPFTSLIEPTLRVIGAVAFMIYSPRVFGSVLRRIALASHRA